MAAFKTLFALSLLIDASFASPLLLNRRQADSTVNMTFVGGPASYSISFPANGVARDISAEESSNFLSISQIFATGVDDIATDCTFDFWEGGVIVANSEGGVDVGPPGPVKSVTCSAGQGTCLAENVDCTTSSPTTGFQFTGTCCTGLVCAAGKCRSTTPQPTCLAQYADCVTSNPTNGTQFIGECCAGLVCAADKCRSASG